MLRQTLFLILCLTTLSQCRHYAISRHLERTEILPELAEIAFSDPQVAGVAEYNDNRNNSGWVYYYIKTDSLSPDWFQSYMAGFMEGDFAYEVIYDVYCNNQYFLKDMTQDQIQSTNDFITNQTQWMKEQIAQNPGDNYWDLVNTTLAQHQGLYDGYMTAVKRAQRTDMEIDYNDFYAVLTYNSDYFDVAAKFKGNNNMPPHCSFLARMTSDSLYVSHTTWFDYVGLLRIYKVIDIFLNNPAVKTTRISFSGQPGYVSSQDDFYILDNGKFVAETSLNTDNDAVFEWIHYDSVPYWIRVTVANYVYDTQETWTNTFFSYRSGTYNNQWLIVDFKNFNATKGNPSQAQNVIWMVEEFYSLNSSQDVTQDMLVKNGYVASYNVPYNESLWELSMNPTTYQNDSRAILFGKYAPGIESLDDFRYVMRLNNKSDTGSYCEAIAARCDLSSNTSFPMGALDCKVTSDTLSPTHQAWIIAGPTNQDLPSFTWDDWPQYNSTRKGIQTLWDFDWVYMDPNSNYSLDAHGEESWKFERHHGHHRFGGFLQF